MTGTELELALLRYNMLSKKRAEANYMSAHTDENAYNDERSECVAEMKKIRDDLRECGYNFAIKGRIQYNMYEIVPINCR